MNNNKGLVPMVVGIAILGLTFYAMSYGWKKGGQAAV